MKWKILLRLIALTNIAVFGVAERAVARPSDALKNFGLVGIWSPNCASPMGIPGSTRTTYQVQDDGHATRMSAMTLPFPGFPQSRLVFEIEDATLLSSKQIKLVGKFTQIICPNCRNTSPPDASPRQMIIEKVGPKIHVIDNCLLDGTRIDVAAGVQGNGQPTAFDSKCEAGS